MLNNKCQTSFTRPGFLKKAQRANPRLYDIGCYNDNLALMLAPDSDEVIRLEKESRSKLSDLIRPFDYDKLNNLYDLFVPQREKSSKQRYFSERSRLSHINVNNGKSKEDLKAHLQDKGIVISELKKLIEKFKGKYMDTKFEKSSVIRQPNSFKSQRPSVLGKPTTFSNSFVRKDFLKSKSVTQNNVSNDFSKPVTAQTLPTKKKSISKNTNVLAPGMYKIHTDYNQTSTSQLPQDSRKTNKRMSFSTGVIPTTSVSRPQLKSNPQGERVMYNNSQGKKQAVEDQCRSVKLSKNKTSLAEIVLFIVDSGCSKHITGNIKLLINFVEKFLGMVKFRNDQIAPILGYGDLVQGAVTIKRVYYVEGLNHSLFFVGQFCDADLEVTFRKSTCFIRDLKGNDLLTGVAGESDLGLGDAVGSGERSRKWEKVGFSSWREILQESNGSFGFQYLRLRQELLEYINVNDNDASESSQPSWGKMCTSTT
nr:integrase, catalytic region, zinc finger, CCHC-type, peptidase aspartic, catalytic [Tanacetum cinerariifolium]